MHPAVPDRMLRCGRAGAAQTLLSVLVRCRARGNYNLPLMRATIAILLWLFAMSAIAAPPIDFAKLTKDQVISRFRVESVYLNDADKPSGARFMHRRTGFTLDLLQIESVPQALHLGEFVSDVATRASRTRRSTCCSARERRAHVRRAGHDVRSSHVERLHADVAHELFLQHRRRRRHLLRRVRRAAERDAASRLHATRRSAARCATSASTRAPTARCGSRRRAPSTTRWSARSANPLPAAVPRRSGTLVYGDEPSARRTTRAASRRGSAR